MKISNGLIIVFFVLLPFAFAYYLYPTLPQIIPTHFNASGEVDAWGDKSTIFLLPGIMGVVSIFVYALLTNIKKIDPKRASNVDNNTFNQFALFTVIFLSVLSLTITYATSHEGVKIEKLMFPLLGLAFAGFGLYMPKIKQNYFAGFRLPWTLESEANWNATHQLAGKVWSIGGLIQFMTGIVLTGQFIFIVFISIVFIMAIVPTIYSYLYFKKEKAAK